MPTGPVLVVGSAGKTGRAVCAALLARGAQVRAAVRPGREASAPAGTEPVGVDLADGHGLRPALDGCSAAYHLAPNVHPDEVGMAQRVAAAARGVGLPHLVFHSVLHPDDARMPHHLHKLAAEEVLREAHPGTLVVLRPSAYHENLLPQVLDGAVALPYSADTPFTTVALADVAEAAATVLLDPARDGEVHDLVGPEVLTTREMVAQAERVLGRPVGLTVSSPAAWAAGPGADLPTAAREALTAMFAAYDEDGLVGDPADLTALLGRRPTSWSDTLRAAAR
ncbi:NmrA family NAD(P)-binding protein [Arthrobacter sp. NEB 688]|uniref:SDR family oxidoreductase n=1 Tax=Arthrobacter sp. NEB 688 TaxID=904039 RepID=UPI0015637E8D|nr:NmrA family NAD(P)-binding protein [Arthrobacter sp. NEB 688]QKE85658.1 NmrA family NAD(P)-binding protein [Arthrobacter sp. NEB 688]